MFRSISPVFNTDKIKVPLLIYQDAQDRRTNMIELNQFVRELQKRKARVNYVWLTKTKPGVAIVASANINNYKCTPNWRNF